MRSVSHPDVVAEDVDAVERLEEVEVIVSGTNVRPCPVPTSADARYLYGAYPLAPAPHPAALAVQGNAVKVLARSWSTFDVNEIVMLLPL
jgi:hypothetical protein